MQKCKLRRNPIGISESEGGKLIARVDDVILIIIIIIILRVTI